MWSYPTFDGRALIGKACANFSWLAPSPTKALEIYENSKWLFFILLQNTPLFVSSLYSEPRIPLTEGGQLQIHARFPIAYANMQLESSGNGQSDKSQVVDKIPKRFKELKFGIQCACHLFR